MIQAKYLIIGSSAAGVSAANYLAKLEPNSEILVVGAENTKPYNKCFLVDWLVGDKSAAQIALGLSPQVRFLSNVKVLELKAVDHIAVLSNGQQVKYEKALLAIGVKPFIPAISGLAEVKHVFNFHDLRDTQNIQNFIKTYHPKTAVVIGAGLTGLECADALWRMGLRVDIVERGDQILGKLVDEAGAAFLTNHIKGCKVKINLKASVSEITSNYIRLDSGLNLQADLIILAAGVRPNCLKIEGGELKKMGGFVLVDDYLQTNLPDIWAAGDLIVAPDLITGKLVPSCSWPDAMLQGNLAAANMLNMSKKMPGLLPIAKSRFFGLDFVSLGQVGEENLTYKQKKTVNSYQKIVLNQQNLVQNALLIGDIADFPIIRRAVLTQQAWVS